MQNSLHHNPKIQDMDRNRRIQSLKNQFGHQKLLTDTDQNAPFNVLKQIKMLRFHEQVDKKLI